MNRANATVQEFLRASTPQVHPLSEGEMRNGARNRMETPSPLTQAMPQASRAFFKFDYILLKGDWKIAANSAEALDAVGRIWRLPLEIVLCAAGLWIIFIATIFAAYRVPAVPVPAKRRN